MADKAFLVDTTKCTGCRACQVACKQWNNLPAENTTFFAGPEYTNPKELSAITYNHVKFYELDRSIPDKPVWKIMHKKCFHCEKPNCLIVCPVIAIHKNDCWVVIDQDKCIGCGACEKGCVYNVPHVNKKDLLQYGMNRPIKKNKSYKCHACTVNERDTPACVHACPTEAIIIDYRIKILEMANKRLEEVKKEYYNTSIYGKDQFGGLHVITILKDLPSEYDLEMNPKPVEIGRVKMINGLYNLLSLFCLGMPFLKRTAYRISQVLTSGKRRIS